MNVKRQSIAACVIYRPMLCALNIGIFGTIHDTLNISYLALNFSSSSNLQPNNYLFKTSLIVSVFVYQFFRYILVSRCLFKNQQWKHQVNE